MKLKKCTVKVPTWTRSEYGEPTPTYTEASPIQMMIAWNASSDQDVNGSIYKEYDFVGLTRALPAEGSLINDTYVVGLVEPGRWNRVFMKHAEGKDRTYGE